MRSVREVFGLEAGGCPPVLLAPMAGYTDAAMRLVSARHGADLTYTEMVSASGVIRRVEKTWALLERLEGEGAAVAHLYGNDAGELAEAAGMVAAEGGWRAVDLNAGCPVRKVTTMGAGAALVRHPERIYAMLVAMRRAVGGIGLTVKTRLGSRPDTVMIFEILRAAEEAGADAITVHARFTSQGHGGETNLALLAEVKRLARIPVIGNGGVFAPRDAWRMVRETGVDGVMVARAAIGNPWLFGDIAAALRAGGEPAFGGRTGVRPRRELGVVREVLEGHLAAQETLLARLGLDGAAREGAMVEAFKGRLFRYLHGLKGSSYLRGRMHLLETMTDVREAIEGCFEREAAFRAKAPTAGEETE